MFHILSRHNLKIAVTVEENPNPSGLVFIMHGLGGFKDQLHIQTFAQAFRDANFTVVLFDATHSFGQSEGDYADATTTGYLSDLEDVLAWAQTQTWYQEPFWLVGHSLGAFCSLLYTEEHPEKVRALAPTSAVVSGKLSAESHEKEKIADWERTGWKEEPSSSKPGLIKRLKYTEWLDRQKYDVLPEAHKLTMPVLLLVGDQDRGTPPEHQKILFDALPGKKELHIIKGAPHTFRDPMHLAEIKEVFHNWIQANL